MPQGLPSHPLGRAARSSIVAAAVGVTAFGLAGPEAAGAAESDEAARGSAAPLTVAAAAGTEKPPSGGAQAGRPPSAKERARSRRKRTGARRKRARRLANVGRPIVHSFSLSRGRAFLYGPPTTVSFRIADRSRKVRVNLVVLGAGGRIVRRIDLGRRRTGVAQRHRLTGLAGGPLPEGTLELRLAARDPAGKRLRPSRKASGRRRLAFRWHAFPLHGRFGFGGEDSRFGAGRPGHTHQGQDIPAPHGTPVLAPRGGRVRTVAFQAAGAGHYVVLDGAGEDRDYVFMHLATGSVRVRPGQTVRTGQRLGSVGNTGVSGGPHLHFEVWEGGPWQAGGRPVDPLPYLKGWAG